ncbi:AGE family epimerase/isomerase [Ruminococcus sp.]|uniref:AGE family epimerase/isomerase n=1 Tax=Ruminococcus sp. TaxID=41978 RepID=UPI0025EA56A0|nr:AGE family epimerase/isomerase [Ruminococcus sp.]MBQ8966309.1 AGE family epimerase/isomerase [Ruminococcus sp.]
MMIEEVKQELTQHIIPFWNGLRDDENGGFYGFKSFDLTLDKKADKGVILHSRILWFYSKAYLTLKDDSLLDYAAHAYRFIKDNCIDYEQGGVYWMMDYKGQPADTMKHTYNIAFAIYALSCYYRASGDKEALSLAYRLFEDIEKNTLDEYGYREAFDRQWNLVDNEALSENGLKADKTMNAILHLIEAYTELYLADGNEKVADRLKFQLGQMRDIVYTPETNALKVFFDTAFGLVGDIHSFGHDIEATWLMDRACDVLGDEELKKQFAEMDLKISHNIQAIALEDGALNNERENDKIDKTRVWWVQAEAVVGFINAYQHCGEEEFLRSARSVWEYIKSDIIDKREGSEWYSEVAFDHKPHDYKEIVGPWKCPYHNGRMCMEVIDRGVDF